MNNNYCHTIETQKRLIINGKIVPKWAENYDRIS